MNEIVSRVITYIIILLIYSIVLNVIRLIYTDIHSMNKKIDETNEVYGAYLKLINLKSDVHFGVEESYFLEDAMTFGRAEDNDVVIGDPFLSKKNTRIYLKNDEYFVEDLGGRNGTLLNGEKLDGRRARLHNGDRVNMGQLGFIFVDPETDAESGGYSNRGAAGDGDYNEEDYDDYDEDDYDEDDYDEDDYDEDY